MNMKKTMIKAVKYLYWGISWGCTFFVLICLVLYLMGGSAYLEQIMEQFPKHALGSVIVGIACGSTSIVYTMEKLSRSLQILIHFTVGLGVYFLTALYLEWIPRQLSWSLAAFFAVGILSFIVIWALFYLYNKNEAQKWNQRLKELEKEGREV